MTPIYHLIVGAEAMLFINMTGTNHQDIRRRDLAPIRLLLLLLLLLLLFSLISLSSIPILYLFRLWHHIVPSSSTFCSRFHDQCCFSFIVRLLTCVGCQSHSRHRSWSQGTRRCPSDLSALFGAMIISIAYLLDSSCVDCSDDRL